ncbi:MAG: phytanoyl-CoA dioxygenase family protein [Planctomycetota bacterium]|nr:phytanoyl-CoA dioxygenase family protein [Planctomycetota bacterium]MDA1139806.1 phytanoyl-CoA dioxygenase family protein [Planctomycetota bacterium]
MNKRQTFFEENGYWIESEPLFDGEELERFRSSMDDILAHKYASGRQPMKGRNFPDRSEPAGLIQINNAWWAGGGIRELSLSPRLGKIAAELLQVNGVCMWHDQLIYKPSQVDTAQNEGNVGWHQDWNYWQACDKPDLITAWVALDDVTKENGAMMVVPRSHRWGIVFDHKTRALDVEKQKEDFEIPAGETLDTVHCEMRAGCASFHHAITLHGSGPNLTERPRLGHAIHMVADHVRYTKSRGVSHSNLDVCPREEGALFRGEQHPVIWQDRAD